MNKVIEYFKSMPAQKNRFGLRVILVFIGVICQGIGVYWLTEVNFGTDPFTVLNLGLSEKLGWTYGNTVFAFNILMLALVLLLGARKIGIGTFANMILVGYSADFTRWIFEKILPEGFFEKFSTRVMILIPALVWFTVAAALYMAVDLGQSPYDAFPFIISDKLPRVSFTLIRIIWDFSVALIGFLLGGKVGIFTILMSLFLGPCITFIKKLLCSKFGFK